MQKFPVGTIVRARGERWRVAGIRSYGDCQVVRVSALGRAPRREPTFLLPFETLVPLERLSRPRAVSGSTWRAACRALIAQETPPGGLQAASRANLALWPHQLAPGLAIVRGLACRLLLADDVGLGKTVQAALIVAELMGRAAIERTLVLTPAGLRDQWCDEFRRRFGIAATIADAATVRRTVAALPAGVNPWSTWPIAIASVDYVKRPEVLAAVAACRWDVAIVDEAHGVATDSDRHEAVAAIAGRASYVLLVTATPHNGDQAAFESLCRIGSVDDHPPLIFRRTRASAGLPSARRTHALRVTPTTAEQRMHRLLQEYTDAVLAERGDVSLACAVLQKRALSSAWSLAESVDRRLGAFAANPPARQQLTLPLDALGELTDEDDSPPWPADVQLGDVNRDGRLLRALSAAARHAAGDESKVDALLRLLRRVHERVVIFTEYRDTLQHVAERLGHAERRFSRDIVILHGGMTAIERRTALAAFRHQAQAVLLATDAAGEGLNLHEGCRLVINLELPWNPVRLEQRIGRVDRIGQRHPVHAIHLIAADTQERALLDRLRDRTALARAVIDQTAAAIAAPVAAAEAERLKTARAVATDGRDHGGRLLLTTPRGRWRRQIGPRRLEVWRVAAEDADGVVIESKLFPLAMAADHARVDDALTIASGPWREAVRQMTNAFTRVRLAREQAIAAVFDAQAPGPFQPGLFDRRQERARIFAAAARASSRRDIEDRIAAIRRQQFVTFRSPELLLVLATSS